MVTKIVLIVIVALVAGFGIGYWVHSYPTQGTHMMSNGQLMDDRATGMMNNATASTSQAVSLALNDIYTTQKVSDKSKLDCSKVSDTQFEKLGDAVMGAGITEEQHTAMENMMGGEGSATLASAHITMGKSYLGCWAPYHSAPSSMPMMGALQ